MIYPQPSKKVLSCFQWPGLRASSLKGYTWGVYIKHALCSWYILFSGIYVGLLSMDSIACFPAFCRRRYIVIKSMEPAALITCCECKTIETTVYNLGGGGGELWLAGGLVFPGLHTSTLPLFIRIKPVSLCISNKRSHFSSLIFLGLYCRRLHNLPGFKLAFDIREYLQICNLLLKHSVFRI